MNIKSLKDGFCSLMWDKLDSKNIPFALISTFEAVLTTLPFESLHNSLEEKTPVAVIVSLQITPL